MKYTKDFQSYTKQEVIMYKIIFSLLFIVTGLFAEFQPGVYTTDSVYLTSISEGSGINHFSVDTGDTFPYSFFDSTYVTEYNDTVQVLYPDSIIRAYQSPPGTSYVYEKRIQGSKHKPIEKLYDTSSANQYGLSNDNYL